MNVVNSSVYRAGGSVASVLAGNQPVSPEQQAAQRELDQFSANLRGLEGRLADTDRLLGMSRRERSRNCNMPELKAAAWNRAREPHIKIATHALIFGAAALGFTALAMGMNPIVGLGAAGALWYGYLQTVKHVVLPIQVDRAVKGALKTEKAGLEQAIPQARAQVAEAENRVRALTLEGLARMDLRGPSAAVKVDEAAVTVGGVRIKVRRSP